MNVHIENSRGNGIAKENYHKAFSGLPDYGTQIKVGSVVNEVEKSEIMECIRQAHDEWINAQASFEYAQDPDMVDYCTYRIKACEIRYRYFIKQARENGIIL